MASGENSVPEVITGGGDIDQFSGSASTPTSGVKRKGWGMGTGFVILRTRSEVDAMDDGFKWRKYGKKKIKSNPIHPRNYYRCSSKGCQVKKRVERDQDDSSCVITAYEGVHNHPTPHTDIALMLPINYWTFGSTLSSSYPPFN